MKAAAGDPPSRDSLSREAGKSEREEEKERKKERKQPNPLKIKEGKREREKRKELKTKTKDIERSEKTQENIRLISKDNRSW